MNIGITFESFLCHGNQDWPLSLTLRVQFHHSRLKTARFSTIESGQHYWLCLASHRQRGHLETVPPFSVPCEGRVARRAAL